MTKQEQSVLECLIRGQEAVSKTQLLRDAFGTEVPLKSNAIEVHMHRLRRKLEGSDIDILALRGRGYFLDVARQSDRGQGGVSGR